MDNPPRGVAAATPELAQDLARRLAPDHAREVEEVSRLAPEAAVRLSLAVSRIACAVLSPGGETLFMMGVEEAGALTGTAVVWMLATPEAGRYPARVLRAARWGLGRAFAVTGAETLEQYIPAWYRTGVRFVRRLGFRTEPSRHGAIVRVSLRREDFYRERSIHGSSNTQHPGSSRPGHGDLPGLSKFQNSRLPERTRRQQP